MPDRLRMQWLNLALSNAISIGTVVAYCFADRRGPKSRVLLTLCNTIAAARGGRNFGKVPGGTQPARLASTGV